MNALQIKWAVLKTMADEIHYMLRAMLVFYALLSLELSYAFLAYS